MNLVWYAKAITDVSRAVEYIRLDNPTVAAKIAQRLLHAVEHLQQFPDAGRRGRAFGTREVVIPEYPFVLRYRVKSGVVQILRVFHTSREWAE